MRRTSVLLLLGLGMLLLVGLFVRHWTFEPPPRSLVGTKQGKPTRKCDATASGLVDAKSVRGFVAECVKTIIAEQLGTESIPDEESQYLDIGADELDCSEIMLELEKQFKLSVPEKDEKRLCASPVKATIEYISARVRTRTTGRSVDENRHSAH